MEIRAEVGATVGVDIAERRSRGKLNTAACSPGSESSCISVADRLDVRHSHHKHHRRPAGRGAHSQMLAANCDAGSTMVMTVAETVVDLMAMVVDLVMMVIGASGVCRDRDYLDDIGPDQRQFGDSRQK